MRGILFQQVSPDLRAACDKCRAAVVRMVSVEMQRPRTILWFCEPCARAIGEAAKGDT